MIAEPGTKTPFHRRKQGETTVLGDLSKLEWQQGPSRFCSHACRRLSSGLFRRQTGGTRCIYVLAYWLG